MLLGLGAAPSVDDLGLDQRTKLVLVGSPYPTLSAEKWGLAAQVRQDRAAVSLEVVRMNHLFPFGG